jgi:hypothetical protein
MEELTSSTYAAAHHIANTPNHDQEEALIYLARNLQVVRDAFAAPISVTSGFRSAALNSAVGGAASSQHLRGEAADITAGDSRRNKELFATIVALRSRGAIRFDQLIWEYGGKWLHVSFSRLRARDEMLSISAHGAIKINDTWKKEIA